jgi:deoxyribodipyrimidine photo-lyase
MISEKRIACLKSAPVRKQGEYVLYWIQSTKRAENNFALSYAIEQANDLKLPLLVYEQVSCSYPYACDRLQQFILENARELGPRLQARGARYFFNLEKDRRQRLRRLPEFAASAALLVTDEFPAFLPPRQTRWLTARVEVPVFAVDSCGIIPLAEMDRQEYAARTIRPKIQRRLPEHLKPVPTPRLQIDSTGLPLPPGNFDFCGRPLAETVASCPIDHQVSPSKFFPGGYRAARTLLANFLRHKLADYAVRKNRPEWEGTSNLSPYLHFGVISPQEVALSVQALGGGSPSVEVFLEELIVRRELSFNYCKFNPGYEALEGLPRWAQATLTRHAMDRRSHLYSLEQFETAQTHDPLWNACQTELLTSGKIHGYLRMYWGKKILDWCRTPAEALEIMIYLNNQYALDGRDPNSWVGILWCLGLHDRPFGERAVFGQIRYMSGESLTRKIDVPGYIERVRQMSVAKSG